MNRRFWLAIHRYAGLSVAFFLIVAGLTGSLLAFYPELDGWLNPERYSVSERKAPILDGFTLRDIAVKSEPQALLNSIPLNITHGKVVEFLLTPKTAPETGTPYQLTHQAIYLNPYSGDIVGFKGESRLWPLDRGNILNFVYELHYSLALGDTGIWIFGIAALIWTIDCFVAFYLTFPKQQSEPAKTRQPLMAAFSSPVAGRSFWSRWAVSWRIKWPSSALRLNFDLHRAGGLWTWLVLLVFAWSSVMFNLNSVYKPVVSAFFEFPEYREILGADLPEPRPIPGLDWRSAYDIGRSYMAELAQNHGFNVIAEDTLSYSPERGTFSYTVKSDHDTGNLALTQVIFDGDTGKFMNIFLPGQYSGYTLTIWLQILHMAKIWGLAYKIFVSLLGILVTMLSVTGVYIWLKKRQAAKAIEKKRGSF